MAKPAPPSNTRFNGRRDARDVHPDMPESELGTLALSVITCLEGLHVMFGSGEQLIGQYPTLDDLVYTQILRNVGIADD